MWQFPTRGDVTFYLGTVVSVIAIFGFLWRVTVGAALKSMREQMVRREDLLKELLELREFLRKEFVAKRNRQ